MIRPVLTLRRRRVLIDVDTQKDLFLADSPGCIRNHRRVLANIRRVVAWARHNNIRMVSTVLCRERTDDRTLMCVEGTHGQEKIGYTVRAKHILYSADGCTDLQREILKRYDQVILEKRSPNPFHEPRADRILSELRADEFVVIGAITEDAIKSTVLGLLVRRKNVTLLTDALGSHDKGAAEIAIRQMEAKGAKLAEIKSLVGPSGLKLVGACDCDRCQGRTSKTTVDRAS